MQHSMSAKRVIEESIKNRDEFEINLSQFLEDFYNCSNNNDRLNLIEEEYGGDYYEDIEVILRITAATVDELCFRYDIERPSWIDKDKYEGSGKPLFYNIDGMSDKDRVYTLLRAPIKFIERNVFVPRQFLVRF